MNKILALPYRILPILIPAIVILLLTFLVQSPYFQLNSEVLSNAIIADLTLTVPFIYFLLIRKRDIPKITVVPIFIICLFAGTAILPTDQQQFLSLIKTWVLPIIELTILGFVIYNINKAIKLFKSKEQRADFYLVVKEVTTELLPAKVSQVFAMEIGMFYYSLFSWKKHRIIESEYTYHLKSSTQLLFGVFIFLIMIETFAVHLLLLQWSAIAAWILTILSAYTALQLLALLKALGRRPIVLAKSRLLLKYSLFADAVVDYSSIEKVETSPKNIDQEVMPRYLSPMNQAEGHNVVIKLKHPVEIHGMYGFKKAAQTIAFYVDNDQDFVSALNQKLQ